MFNFTEFRKLIKAVENRPEDKFHMSEWMSPCGTVCCAVGSYCDDHPESQLKLVDVSDRHSMLYPSLNGSFGENSFQLVGDFFGISYDESKSLFSRIGYRIKNDRTRIIKKEVLDKCKKFYTTKIFEYHAQLPKKIIHRELV